MTIEPTPVPIDLRRRTPPDTCLPHPCDCGECAWGNVALDGSGYALGEAMPPSLTPLRGSYTAACGHNQTVVTDEGIVGVVRWIKGSYRFFPAHLGSVALRDYWLALGQSAPPLEIV